MLLKMEILKYNKATDDDINVVSTGDYLTYNKDKNTFIYYLSVKGDVNGDGEIAPLDYIKIKNHIMGAKLITGDEYLNAADMSNDGVISPLDYVKVRNYIYPPLS